MAEVKVLVRLNGDTSNQEILDLTDKGVSTVEDLIKEAQELFGIERESISRLQIEDETFGAFVNLRESNVSKVQNKTSLNVVLKGTSVSNDAGEVPRDCPPEKMLCAGCSDLGVKPFAHDGDHQAAIAPNNRLWDKTTIHTYFLNDIPQSWKYSGHKYPVNAQDPSHVIDYSDILRLANNWSTQLPPSIQKEKRESVPKFVEVSDPKISDIRVWFNVMGKRESKVGTDATRVPKGGQEQNATLFLDLGEVDSYKEHLVMHEFGHALGLGHEHQRVVFWKNIGKFLDIAKVKSFFGDGFSTNNVESYKKGTPGPRSEYDPDSIMHYWFKPCDWLQSPYNTLQKVNSLGPNTITPEEKTALLGFHNKGNRLAEEISLKDHQFIADTYYDHLQKGATGSSKGPTNIPPAAPGQDRRLGLEHLAAIQTAVFDIRSKWYCFGLQLDVDPPSLEAIRERFHGDPDKCLPAVLQQWLSKKEGTHFHEILTALRNRTVGNGALAIKIEHYSEREKQKIGFYL